MSDIKLAKLAEKRIRVTMSHQLAWNMYLVFCDVWEAADYPLDNNLAQDLDDWWQSVQRAADKQIRAERRERILAEAKASANTTTKARRDE